MSDATISTPREPVPPRLPTLLITGAGGFVMQNCIPVWLELGYRVIAVDQVEMPPQSTGEYFPVIVDAGDPTSVFQQVQAHGIDHVDAIIHAAAITADPEKAGMTPEQHLRANLLPALAWLEWANEHGVGRTIMISSSAVYAHTAGIVSEDQPPTPIGTYAVAKATIEAHVTTLRQEYGRDVLTIRLGNIYGLNEQMSQSRPRISMIGQMLPHAKMTTGTTVFSIPNVAREWTFAPDVAYGIHALLQTILLSNSLYHVAAGQKSSPADIAIVFQQVIPETAFQNIFPTTSQEHINRLYPRLGTLLSTRLKEDTGFDNWTPIEEGIRQALLYDQPIAEGVQS